MANKLYEESVQNQRNINNIRNDFLKNLQDLKSMGGDPNQKIQELLNSGKVTQEQYNMAVQRAQHLKNLFNL